MIHSSSYITVIHSRFSRKQDLECIAAQRALISVRIGLNYTGQGSYPWTSYRSLCFLWYHQPSPHVREPWHANWHEAGWRHFNDVHCFMYEVRGVSPSTDACWHHLSVVEEEPAAIVPLSCDEAVSVQLENQPAGRLPICAGWVFISLYFGKV